MTGSQPRVVIVPDPHHPGWYNAVGRGLLPIASNIASVERTVSGIAFHQDFADEVRAALTTAGYHISDGQARTDPARPQPRRGVHGYYHPPGEDTECPRCNPSHARNRPNG